MTVSELVPPPAVLTPLQAHYPDLQICSHTKQTALCAAIWRQWHELVVVLVCDFHTCNASAAGPLPAVLPKEKTRGGKTRGGMSALDPGALTAREGAIIGFATKAGDHRPRSRDKSAATVPVPGSNQRRRTRCGPRSCHTDSCQSF